MALAEGVGARVAYKFYPSGVMQSNVEEANSVLGATGGQTLRRVSSSMSLSKDTFQSEEVRNDRQIADFRHGVRRAQGDVAGELSAGTWGDFFQALFRGTWAAAPAALAPATITSVAADAVASTLTLTAGDAQALGLRIGQVIRLSGGLAANNARNFLITSMTGTQGRTLGVFPAPTTMSANTGVTITVAGRRIINPSAGFVPRKLALEIYQDDLDIARLFTECRVNSMAMGLPPNGMATINFGMTGRNMQVLSAAQAPFLTGPADPNLNPILASPNGLVMVNGVASGVLTGLDLSVDLAVEANPVVGQNFVPDIILGRFNMTGTMTAYFENADLLNYFLNETEIGLLAYLTGSNDAAASAMSVYLPRIKVSNADVPTTGEGGQMITLPFQALKGSGVPLGVDATTCQIFETV